jgi:hypothetical protein
MISRDRAQLGDRRHDLETFEMWFGITSAGTKNGAVLGGVGLNSIIASIQHEDSDGKEPECAWSAHIYYIRTGGKSVRTRRLDRIDGAARRVAPGKGLDPKLQNESCRQVSPSQVRDARGPHGGNEHTPRAIASDGVQLQFRTCFKISSRSATSAGVCVRPRVRLFGWRFPCASYTLSISATSARGIPVRHN